MVTRESVLSLLREGRSYEEVGEALGVVPGLAYLVATGLPADGSDVVSYDESARAGVLPGSSQHLANPKTTVPQRDPAVDEWIRGRAAHDFALQIAAVQHGVEPPRVEGAEESDDVISVLGAEHGQVTFLVKELEAVPSAAKGGDLQDAARRVEIVELLTARAARHEDLEEQLFWPRVREWLPDGKDLADRARKQESEGAQLLRELRGTAATTPEFDDIVTRASKALRTHVAFEDGVFLAVREQVPLGDREETGRRFKDALGLPYKATRQEEEGE
jgi:hypothetical protein